MTIVTRIAFLLAIAFASLLSMSANVEAQIFRRLRENIRANNLPQRPLSPQPKRPAQVAPQSNGQFGQRLTPYAKLSPQQRQADALAQSKAVAEAAESAEDTRGKDRTREAETDTVDVRVVTYYDPRTGRTFQRRFVLPPKNQTESKPDLDNTVAGRGPMSDSSNSRKTDALTQSDAPSPKFGIPPLTNLRTESDVERSTVDAGQLPVLAGPQFTIAPPVVERPAYDEVLVDGAVVPASGVLDVDPSSLEVQSVMEPQDDAPVAFSVLVTGDHDNSATVAPSTNSEVEIESADEIEAFFGSPH